MELIRGRSRLRSAIVDFDEAHPSSIVPSGEDRRVESRRQRRGNGGFPRIGGRQTSSGDLGGLRSIIRPVVIRSEESAILVAQLQRRILERIRNSKRAEAGAETADNDAIIALVAAQNDSS